MPNRFPSPFEAETPPGAEGWEDLYTYSLPFSEDRREYEAATFWFQDSIHWAEPLTPWDATWYEYAIAALSQYNTRHYLIPPALGIDYRVLNGYTYLTPVPVLDGAEIEARVPQFMERAGFYFMNWGDLYDKWLDKMKDLIDEMEAISFSPLPEKEDLEVITEGHGTGSGLTIQEEYRGLLNLGLKLWHYHFEFLNLGYAAYLDYFGFCKQAFPNIPDSPSPGWWRASRSTSSVPTRNSRLWPPSWWNTAWRSSLPEDSTPWRGRRSWTTGTR